MATLLFAIVIDCDPTLVDPDVMAYEFVDIINESSSFSGDVKVSGIPAPVWMTLETLERLRKGTSSTWTNWSSGCGQR